MMTTLFIVLAFSVLAIAGVGVGVYVRIRKRNAARSETRGEGVDLTA